MLRSIVLSFNRQFPISTYVHTIEMGGEVQLILPNVNSKVESLALGYLANSVLILGFKLKSVHRADNFVSAL